MCVTVESLKLKQIPLCAALDSVFTLVRRFKVPVKSMLKQMLTTARLQPICGISTMHRGVCLCQAMLWIAGVVLLNCCQAHCDAVDTWCLPAALHLNCALGAGTMPASECP